jgi:hypothetical protein
VVGEAVGYAVGYAVGDMVGAEVGYAVGYVVLTRQWVSPCWWLWYLKPSSVQQVLSSMTVTIFSRINWPPASRTMLLTRETRVATVTGASSSMVTCAHFIGQ